MPFIKYKTDGLHTMRDVANACGMTDRKLWGLVRELGVLPEPLTRVGRRDYYSDSEMQALLKKLEALRAKGVRV